MKDVYIHHHLGMGDHITCNAIVRNIAKNYDKVYLFYKDLPWHLPNLQYMYRDMGDKIKIIFSGDFAPVIPVEKISNDHFNDISKFFETADLHITNLESPLTSCQQAIKKTGPSLKANPSSVSLLQQAKVNIACLANNHIFDYGEQGIKDTINICEENNIDTIVIVKSI